MSKKMRVFSLLLALALAFGLLAGCNKDESVGKSDENPGGSDEPNKSGSAKDSVVIATMGETPTLSPVEHNAVAGGYMNQLTYSTLFRTGMDLEPEPNLVESYENISDTVWEFKLKEGVKFHNGETMTAEDVKASIENAQQYAEVNLYNRDIINIEVVDELTVRMETREVDAMMLSNLTSQGNSVLPKSLLDSGHDFNTEPIGTGPYKFVKWNRGDSVEFEAFEDYFLGEPAIKHMTWKIIPEGSSRTIALEAGEIDMIIEVEAMDADRLRANDDIEVIQFNHTSHNWLMLNNEKPGLDNQNVRHAINTAIDKESVVTVAYNGMASPALSQMPMNFEGATEENADVYDVEKAKEWLDKSGVDPASIELSIICSDDTKKRAGEVIQANLKEIGINAQIESMDLATYLSVTAEGNFTASIGGYSSSNLLSYVVGVYHSSSINASNKTRLNDAKVDELIDKAKITLDPAERKGIMEELSARLNELCSQAPLYQPLTLRAYKKGLQGVKVSDAGGIRWADLSWGA